MKIKASLLIVVTILLNVLYTCSKPATEVAVVGTLHGYHKKNKNYTYKKLYKFIETYNPDVIAVEIRPEDIGSPVDYLSKYYPREMLDVISLFSNRKIYGIDWWNEDIEGLKMSDEIISTVANIVWAKAYQADTNFLKQKPEVINELNEKKLTIAANASINEIVQGDYDSLNFSYYAELGKFLNGSPHEQLYQSYMKRHEMIAQRMVEVVKQNPGKKILFLTGADHQVYARQKLEETFRDEIALNTIFD